MSVQNNNALNIESPLSVASWNVRGINNLKKRASILRALKREKLDIIALQETYITGSNDYDDIQRQWGGSIHFNSGSNRSKGVITLFSQSMKNELIEVVHKSNDGRILVSSLTYEKEKFIIVNVYSPSDEDKSKSTFIASLLDLIHNIMTDVTDVNLICLGDFNIAISDLDVVAGASHHKNIIASLNDFIQSLRMVDSWRLVNPLEKTYTWRRTNPTVAKRLDYILTSETLANAISHSYIKDIGFSDHRLVVTKFEFSSFKFGKGLYKLNTTLLKDINYCRIIESAIDDVVLEYQGVDDNLIWEVIKTNISETSQSYGRFKSKLNFDRCIELQQSLNKLENEFIDNPKCEDIGAQITKIKNELELHEYEKTKGAAVRANIKYIEEGEKCTNYFLSLERCRSKVNTIKRLKCDNGEVILDEKQIVNNIGKHFFKRFNSSTKSDAEIHHYFTEFSKNVKLPKLSEDDALRLEADITESELETAIKSLEHGSAPGRDGLPLELYIVFWRRLKKPFMECIRYCEELCRLTKSQRLGVLSLFHKGSDLPSDNLDNWRPLSLVNTDYKILAKVFSLRTESVIDTIIGKQQMGFVKGRNIAYVHRQIDDMLTLHRHSRKSGIMVAIDFKQAFDAINIPCILKSLELFGFGPRFIKWIKILNTDRLFSVKNGGHISQSFGMHNGVRQGCPISPQLFIIAAEVLAQKIIQDSNIVGLKSASLGTTRLDAAYNVVLKILQYADDTSLFLKNTDSLKRAIGVFKFFSKCSDLHLNLNKSFAMSLNGDKVETDVQLIFQNTIKTLGIIYSNTVAASEIELNWRKRIDTVIKTLSLWSRRNLSLVGKLHIIKTFGLSQFVHIMQSISLPEYALTEINRIFFRFLWNKNFSDTKPNDKVKRAVMTNDLDEGGLKMIDMHKLQESILLSWAEDLLSPIDSPWKQTAIAFFQPLGGKIAFKSKLIYKNMKNTHTLCSPFWRSVLSTWLNYCGNDRNTYHSYNDPLFNNSFISIQNKPIFFQACIDKGIFKIKDMVVNGQVISLAQFEHKRGVDGQSFLEYCAIRKALTPFLRRTLLTNEDIFEFQGTPLGKLGRKFFYKATNITEEPASVDFWNKKYDIDICRHHWQLIHSLKESRLKALAWKIIHNIYPTNVSLHKMKLSDTPLCTTCNEMETIDHFFYHCKNVNNLWTEIQQIILVKLNAKIKINDKMVLLGPVHLTGINIKTQMKIKHILTIGILAISKFKHGNYRNLKVLFESEARLRNI